MGNAGGLAFEADPVVELDSLFHREHGGTGVGPDLFKLGDVVIQVGIGGVEGPDSVDEVFPYGKDASWDGAHHPLVEAGEVDVVAESLEGVRKEADGLGAIGHKDDVFGLEDFFDFGEGDDLAVEIIDSAETDEAGSGGDVGFNEICPFVRLNWAWG